MPLKNTKKNTAIVSVPFPQGKDVYNVIMLRIEPDLVDSAIPLLDTKYKDETPAENKKRLQRYRAAYREYDRQFAAWVKDMDLLVKQYRRHVFKVEEEESLSQDREHIHMLEGAMNGDFDSVPTK